MLDFVTSVQDWMTECGRPAPRCPVSALSGDDAGVIWQALGALGIRRESVVRDIDSVCTRNPRALGLFELLAISAANATLLDGEIVPELCFLPHNRDLFPVRELLEHPALSRRFYKLDLADLDEHHPYASLDRAKLGGSEVFFENVSYQYQYPQLGDRYAVATLYASTQNVNQRLQAYFTRLAREEADRQDLEEQERERRRRDAVGPHFLAIEHLQARIKQLEAKEKP